MFCGIGLSKEFSQEIGTLNLDVFHMRNFRCDTRFFSYCNSLKTLYLVHPDVGMGGVNPPDELEKLVIYCPKSSKDRREAIYAKLQIDVDKCHALKEM